MENTILGESAGSWVQWGATVAVAVLTILFGSRRYLLDHSPKLIYRILPFAENRSKNAVSKSSGSTIVIQNVGGVPTSVTFLGVSTHRMRISWHIQMWLWNVLRRYKWTLGYSEKLSPKLAKFEDAKVTQLVDWIRADVVSPDPEMLGPYGNVKRISVDESTMVTMLTTLAHENNSFFDRIEAHKTLYFDDLMQTTIGKIERFQRVERYHSGKSQLYNNLLVRLQLK